MLIHAYKHAILMAESESRVEMAVYSHAPVDVVAKRVLERPDIYRRWEAEHDRLLRPPRDPGRRLLDRQLDLGHQRGRPGVDRVQPHRFARRVVQHDGHAIEVRDPTKDLRQLPQEAAQIAARGGRARDVEQGVVNIRREAQTLAAAAVPRVDGRTAGLLLRVHPKPGL